MHCLLFLVIQKYGVVGFFFFFFCGTENYLLFLDFVWLHIKIFSIKTLKNVFLMLFKFYSTTI